MMAFAVLGFLWQNLLHVRSPHNSFPEVERSGGTGVQMRFRTEPARVIGGEPALIEISVVDGAGKQVRDLTIVHERPMHLFIVASEFQEFDHVHPDRGEDGNFRIVHTFRRAGLYRIFAEVTPESGAAGVGTHTIEAEGGLPGSKEELAESRISVTEGTRIELRSAARLKAGTVALLQFLVTDSVTGKSVQDLELYLGAPIHVAVVGDEGSFLHAHTPDHGAEAGGTHSGHHAPGRAQVMEVHVAFPHPGLYRVWAQFQRAGRLITAPFVVRVSP